MKLTEYYERSVGFCKIYDGMFTGRTKGREREGSQWIGRIYVGKRRGKVVKRGG